MKLPELAQVPGIPESAITDQLITTLPALAAGAPWTCRARAVLWLGRGGKAATAALAPAVAKQATALSVVGGMVHYEHTPVGPYDEVFGAVAFRQGRRLSASVPFIAVNSAVSLVGGRSNWSLPKTLAQFEGEPAPGRTMTASRDDWTVRAATRATGPAVPITISRPITQEWPGGAVRMATLRARGRGRPALVTVDVDAEPTLSSWLRSGRHLGIAFDTIRFTLAAPL